MGGIVVPSRDRSSDALRSSKTTSCDHPISSCDRVISQFVRLRGKTSHAQSFKTSRPDRVGASMMIRCVRLWSGLDGKSHFEEGAVDLEPGPRGDALSGKFPISAVSFQETRADP